MRHLIRTSSKITPKAINDCLVTGKYHCKRENHGIWRQFLVWIQLAKAGHDKKTGKIKRRREDRWIRVSV